VRGSMAVSVIVRPGAEPWAPRPDVVSRLSVLFPGEDAIVEILPRSMVERAWVTAHGNAWPFPGRHPFRAWARDQQVRIFVDGTETPESVTWLMLHELAHVALRRQPYLDLAYRSIPRPKGYVVDDEAHESYPEEQVANQVADAISAHFGLPLGLNRHWWRERVEAQHG